MSNTIDTNIITYIEDTAIALKEQRIKWEEGAFKRSNEELYDLLDACLKFFNEVQGNTKKCKALNAYLNTNGLKFNEGASLATRIVRAVFNSNFQKRAYGYARVIAIAAEEKPSDESMSTFITKRGGIEVLRRTKLNGKSPAEQRKGDIAFAKDHLEAAAPILASVKVSAPIKPNAGADHNLLVAVMRREADGSYSVVHQTAAAGVVNEALAQAGKKLGGKANRAEKQQKQKQDAANSEAALDEAANAAQAFAA